MDGKFGILLVASFLLLACIVEARPGAFDVKANSNVDISQAFLNAWKEACAATEASSVVIPGGTYLLKPTTFGGPCKAPIEVQVQGTIKAPEDHTIFKGGSWVTFNNVDQFTLSGGGTFDAMGSKTWALNDCHKSSCKDFPISLSFNSITNAIIRDITSKDSKFFHFNVIGGRNFTFQHVTISAPEESINTDGIHIGRSNGITIRDSTIATGDDCVSLGDGSKQISVTNVKCGPGHGISIGSLGKYPNEEPVEGVFVKNCTLINTTNGVRVKTWPGSPNGAASDMHFEDIVMRNVSNPILIDQEYCPWNKCKRGQASKIKISKVSFKNIRGTSALPEAVTLVCSRNLPCQNVEIGDVDLKYEGPLGPITTKCANVQPKFTGTMKPEICAHSTQSS